MRTRPVNLHVGTESRCKCRMDMTTDVAPATMSVVDEFTLEVAADRDTAYDTLFHRGRRVASVEARRVEAQFRLANGSTLLLLNDDRPYKEVLTILLVSAGLRVLDTRRVGGAFTPGYLTSAYSTSPNDVVFCWHDLDQMVTVRQHRSPFGWRTRWLAVTDIPMQLPNSPRAHLPRLRSLLPALPRWRAIRWPKRLRWR